MPERTLPVAEMGTRQSEAITRYRRRSDLQRIGILHHRLPKRFLQRSGQKGISCRLEWWRKICRPKRIRQCSFTGSDQGTREKASERSWLINGAAISIESDARTHRTGTSRTRADGQCEIHGKGAWYFPFLQVRRYKTRLSDSAHSRSCVY
jgi:hypothetical protein